VSGGERPHALASFVRKGGATEHDPECGVDLSTG
jgi:hypothetical protein